MPKIQVNGVNLYYEIAGTGPTLVLVSGLSADHSVWGSVFYHLIKQYRVVLIDNRGAGQSDAPKGDYSIDMMSNDLAHFCQALHIPMAHFIGSSMGGAIVQNLAHKYPKLVNSLIIVNSAAKFDPVIVLYEQAYSELAHSHTTAPESLVKMTLCWSYSGHYLSQKNRLNKLVKMKLNYPYPTKLDAIKSQMKALQLFDSTSYLAEIKTPCLVIGSDQDRLCMERQTRALAKGIPGAEYAFFENCGHLPQIECPAQFVSAVNTFIGKNKSLK